MQAVLLRLRLIVFVLLYLPFYDLSYGYDALNGDYYLPDKSYDNKPGWSVGVNMPRKSCLTYTFFEDDAMLMLGADHSRGDLTYFAMMAGKKWKYVGDKMYAIEVYYDGNLSWAGQGFGVEVSSYKGVTIENLTADDVGRFARGNGLSLVVNGTTQARFSLDGALDAIHRLVTCAIEVEAGRVPLDPTPSIIPSLDARNHPETAVAQGAKSPKPDAAPTRPQPRDEPAPQKPDEERDTSPQAMRYDEGDHWRVYINKADQVCQFDLSLGEQRAVFYAPVLSGLVQYNATFVDNSSPATKNEYDYEIENYGELISSGKTNSFAFKERAYHSVYELTDKILNAVSRSKALVVKFDGNEFGSYDMTAFRLGFGRFFDCVGELGVRSPAETREEPEGRYASGDDWEVSIDKAKRTCDVILDYGSEAIILNSRPPSAEVPYYLAFARENWVPPKDEYELEVVNDAKTKFLAKAKTFRDGKIGYTVLHELNEDFFDFLTHSRVLRTKAKGIPPERYDLSGFGHALQRFSDCLEEVRDVKSSSSPKIRRMN